MSFGDATVLEEFRRAAARFDHTKFSEVFFGGRELDAAIFRGGGFEHEIKTVGDGEFRSAYPDLQGVVAGIIASFDWSRRTGLSFRRRGASRHEDRGKQQQSPARKCGVLALTRSELRPQDRLMSFLPSSRVGAHQLALGEDVAVHRVQ